MPPHSPDWWRWFHVILGTYGSWLPGDPRGFRTRHHRDHVDGDYKSPPPPGIYEHFHETNTATLPSDEADPFAEKVEALLAERLAARQAKDYARADAIRDEIDAMGIEVMDSPEGTTWRRKLSV